MTTFWRHWWQLIFSAWNLYHICHITNSFYRRMMHEEDERSPNEKSHAYHFSITYNGCDFCWLTPSAILALPKCLFKGWRLKCRGFICLRSCSRHCNWIWSALYKDEHKKDAKHKKLLNLLCIVYYNLVNKITVWCCRKSRGRCSLNVCLKFPLPNFPVLFGPND